VAAGSQKVVALMIEPGMLEFGTSDLGGEAPRVEGDLELELWRLRQDVVNAASDIGLTIGAAIQGMPSGGPPESRDYVWGGLLALAETLPVLSASIVQQLSILGGKVDELTNLVANPEATRADELYRRAVNAFANDWAEEAAVDARLAVEADPYHFGAHYLLGGIAMTERESVEAGACFARAARYAAPKKPQVAVAAALASIHSYRVSGNHVDDATAVGVRTLAALKKFHKDTESCPQLLLATAQLTSDSSYASKAFLEDPSLVAVALAGGLPNVEEACAGIIAPLAERVQHLGAMLDELYQGPLSPVLPLIRELNLPGLQVCKSCDRWLIWRPQSRPLVWKVEWATCYDRDARPIELDAFIERANRARGRSRVPAESPSAQIVGKLAYTESELFNCWALAGRWFSSVLMAENPEVKHRHDWAPHYQWWSVNHQLSKPLPLFLKVGDPGC
jgi:hypothetical protein